MNPILSREVDHRMRDSRTYFVPMVYILVLGLATLGAYLVMTEIGDVPYTTVEGWVTGKVIFHLVAFTQMTLILLLVPSVSAGAITGERDRATLALLLVTPLARGKIVAGKLIAPILYVLLLVSTSMPFAALSFGFGGTDLELLATTYGCLIMTALFLASMGLAVSTVMRRTVPAVLLAYGLVAALIVGSGVAELALHILDKDLETIVFAYLNPFTPLVLAILIDVDSIPATIHWWITPLVQLWLGLVCLAIAAIRLHSMRE